MTRYRHMQVGWAMLGMLGVSVVSVAVSIPLVQADGAGRAVLAIASAVLAAAVLVFCSLTVTVDHAHVTVRFGLTPLRKRIRLADIASFEAVRNPWYFGWGIQRYGPGWLYNVSGFEAIETRPHGRQGAAHRHGRLAGIASSALGGGRRTVARSRRQTGGYRANLAMTGRKRCAGNHFCCC